MIIIQENELSVLIPDCLNYLVVGNFSGKHHIVGTMVQGIEIIQVNSKTNVNTCELRKSSYLPISCNSLSTLYLTLALPKLWRTTNNWTTGDDLGCDHFPVTCELTFTKELMLNSNIVYIEYNFNKTYWAAFMAKTNIATAMLIFFFYN